MRADIERLQLAREFFNVVIVVRFPFRPLAEALAHSLKPGGLLFYRTFNTNYLREKPALNRNNLLAPGELTSLFSALDVIETNDSPGLDDSLSFLIGRRRH
jgi:tellurite methyltransferase